jgi:hypothetical protein
VPLVYSTKKVPLIYSIEKNPYLDWILFFFIKSCMKRLRKFGGWKEFFFVIFVVCQKKHEKNTWWTITSPCAKQKHTAKLNNDNGHFFANYTVHQRHSQCTHTHLYEYTHANPTPKSIFEDCVGKSSRLTKSPQTPYCRRERHLPLKTQTPLNPKKFAHTESRTQDLRCYRGSCNH